MSRKFCAGVLRSQSCPLLPPTGCWNKEDSPDTDLSGIRGIDIDIRHSAEIESALSPYIPNEPPRDNILYSAGCPLAHVGLSHNLVPPHDLVFALVQVLFVFPPHVSRLAREPVLPDLEVRVVLPLVCIGVVQGDVEREVGRIALFCLRLIGGRRRVVEW